MIHLTLNTGDSRISPRAEVADEIIRTLRPLVARGKFQLPGPFSAWVCEVVRHPGYATFALSRAGDHAVMGAIVWDPDTAAWSDLESSYLALGDKGVPMPGDNQSPSEPTTLPWCAVVLLPAMLLAARADIDWLGDFERCLAWTIIAAK